jgi:hypothetical protein
MLGKKVSFSSNRVFVDMFINAIRRDIDATSKEQSREKGFFITYGYDVSADRFFGDNLRLIPLGDRVQ